MATLPRQLDVLRALIRIAAAQYRLRVDDFSDLLPAVDEASTILVRHARPSQVLTCIFDVDTDDRLNVKLAVRADAPINLTTTSFGWILLRTLVDDVILEQSPTAVEEDRTVTITLIKALQEGS